MTKEAAITFDHNQTGVRVPARALTQAGFREWIVSAECPDEARASWIDGEVLIDMSPEAIDTHNNVKTALIVTLGALVRDEERGELFADGVLFTNQEAGVSTEPDVTFVSFTAVEQGRVHFTAKAGRPDDRLELQGTPDLVAEVLSDSSERKDDELLRGAYARAGVPEYWVIDARSDTLRFEILVLDGGSYQKATESRVFGRAFTLTRTKNRLQRWTYRLSSP